MNDGDVAYTCSFFPNLMTVDYTRPACDLLPFNSTWLRSGTYCGATLFDYNAPSRICVCVCVCWSRVHTLPALRQACRTRSRLVWLRYRAEPGGRGRGFNLEKLFSVFIYIHTHTHTRVYSYSDFKNVRKVLYVTNSTKGYRFEETLINSYTSTKQKNILSVRVRKNVGEPSAERKKFLIFKLA